MMEFTKMHGLGNDFIVVDGECELDPVEIARLCDRHTGIGADGIITVEKNGDDPLKIVYWNSDGTIAKTCGNGLRCAVLYAVNKGLVEPGEIEVDTHVGRLKANWDGKNPRDIDAQVGKVVNENKQIEIEDYTFHRANVGNDHAIAYVDEVDSVDIDTIGPQVELDEAFPQKADAEFVEVDGNDLRIRIWERGSGATLSSATGMVCSAIVSQDLGKVTLPITVHTRGGKGKVWIDEDGYARVTGPAKLVYEGTIDI